MKGICLVVLLTVSLASYAQTWNEWFRQKKTQIQYLTQQVTGLQMYAEYLNKGYKIAKSGLQTIGNVRKGELNLHQAFVSSLSTLIPQGNFVYALASFATQRLNLIISSIKYQNKILPVELVLYDRDGLSGIHVSNIQRSDVAKQSGSEAISNLDMASFDPSIGMQAASAGIAATKALLNKKVKTIKVTVPAGYKVFLKSNVEN